MCSPAALSIPNALRLGLLAIALVLGLSSAHAFESGPHRDITEHALSLATGPALVNRDAQDEINGSFFLGTGNLGSNLYQTDAYRHFDNNASPAAVCVNANFVWTSFMREILAGAELVTLPAYDRLRDEHAARLAVGKLLHAVQDFYAHSNWIELGNRTPAPLFPACDPAALPAGLQTGFFEISVNQLLSGCPPGGPPPPFSLCHLQLNKDGLFDHGLDPVPGLFDTAAAPGILVSASTPGARPMTHHAYAAKLADQHTRLVYDLIRNEIASHAVALGQNVAWGCASRKLFQVGYADACLDITGHWNVVASPSGFPPVGLPFAFLHSPSNKVVGWIDSTQCGHLDLSARLTAPGVFSGLVQSCPASAGGCPSQVDLPLKLTYRGQGQIGGEITAIDLEWRNNTCNELSRTVQPFVLQVQ